MVRGSETRENSVVVARKRIAPYHFMCEDTQDATENRRRVKEGYATAWWQAIEASGTGVVGDLPILNRRKIPLELTSDEMCMV